MSNAGELCSDKGAYPVRDKDECRVAIPFIKSDYPSAEDNIDYDYTWPSRPKGCFLHLPNNNVHWNPGEGHQNMENRQICKANGK